MANTVIAIRSSGTAAATPSLGVIANGEISINYADGILYYKTASNTLGSIRTTQPAGLTTEIQFNDAGSFGSDSTLTFNKTNKVITLSGSLNVTNNTISTSNTTGAVVITGGVGISGKVYTGAIVVTGPTSNGITFADGTTQYTANAGTGGGSGTFTGGAVTGNTQFTNTSVSTSNTTGAVTISGGLGVSGNVYTGSLVITGNSANGITFTDNTQLTTAYAMSIVASQGWFLP